MSDTRRNIEVLRKIEFLEEFPGLASMLEGMAQDEQELLMANRAENAGLIGYELRRDPGKSEQEIKALHYLAQVDKNTAALAKNLRPEISPLIEAYMDLWGTVKTAEGGVDQAQIQQLGEALGKSIDRLSQYDDGVDNAVSSLPASAYTALQTAFNNNTVQAGGRRRLAVGKGDDMALALRDVLIGLPNSQQKGAVIAWIATRMGKSPGGLMQELRTARGTSASVKQGLLNQERELQRHRRNAYTERDVLEAEKQSALQLIQRESVGMPGEIRSLFQTLIGAADTPEKLAQVLGMSGPGVPETEASKKMQDLVDQILEEDGDAGYWLSDAEWRDKIINSPEWDEAVRAYGYSGDRHEIYDRLVDRWEDAAGNARDESWAKEAFRIRHGLAERPSAGDRVRAWLTAVGPGREGQAYRAFRDQQYETAGVPRDEEGGWKEGRKAYKEIVQGNQELDDAWEGVEISTEDGAEAPAEVEVEAEVEEVEGGGSWGPVGAPANLMGEALPSRKEGNEFRVWFRENHPEKAEEIDLDAAGSHTNSYVRKAWEYAGQDYLDEKADAAEETPEETPEGTEATVLPPRTIRGDEEEEEEVEDIEAAPETEEKAAEEEGSAREEVDASLRRQAELEARRQEELDSPTQARKEKFVRRQQEARATQGPGFDDPSQKEKNMFRDIPLTGHTEDPEFAPYPEGGWDTETPRGPGHGATSFETTKGTGFSNVSAKVASNPNLGQAGGMQTPDRAAMSNATRRIQRVMESAKERMEKKKLEDAQRSQRGASPSGVA